MDNLVKRKELDEAVSSINWAVLLGACLAGLNIPADKDYDVILKIANIYPWLFLYMQALVFKFWIQKLFRVVIGIVFVTAPIFSVFGAAVSEFYDYAVWGCWMFYVGSIINLNLARFRKNYDYYLDLNSK